MVQGTDKSYYDYSYSVMIELKRKEMRHENIVLAATIIKNGGNNNFTS